MRSCAWAVMAGFILFNPGFILADEPGGDVPRDAGEALRALYRNLMQTEGYILTFEMAYGPWSAEETTLQHALRVHRHRGKMYRRILSLDDGSIFLSMRGGAIYDAEHEKWRKLSRPRHGRELQTLLRFPEEHLARAARHSRAAAWVGDGPAPSEDADLSGASEGKEELTVRVEASRAEAADFLTELRNNSPCAGGECYTDDKTSRTCRLHDFLPRINKKTSRLVHEIRLDSERLLPVELHLVLTAELNREFVLRSELNKTYDAFRCQLAYQLSDFGSVTELKIPKAAAKYLR